VVVAFYLGLAIAAFFWHGASQGDNDIWNAPGSDPAWMWGGPALGAALGGLAVLLMRVMDRPERFPWMAWMGELEREFFDVLGELGRGEVIALALASSIAEELFFRGAMMDAWGVVVSTLVFGLAHIPPRLSLWPWTAMAGVFGLLMAGLTLATGNLGAAVAFHFAVNALNLRKIADSRRARRSPGAKA
jgi:membrane protease YdiL (CAAX protease family)